MSLVQDWEKVKSYGNGITLLFSSQTSMVKVVLDAGDEGEFSQDVGPFDTKGIDDVAESLRSGYVGFAPQATRMIGNAVASLSMAAALD